MSRSPLPWLFVPSLAVLLAAVHGPPVQAQPAAAAADLRIAWEVKNRFRLFRHESDFLRHVAAERGDGVLAAERRLASASAGRGWARLVLNGLCIDGVGNVAVTCERDGVRESYLAPVDHPIGVRLAEPVAAAECTWRFEQIDQPVQQFTAPCGDEMKLRIRTGSPTFATVDVSRPDGTSGRGSAELLVQDLLVAGLGDSIASGEGNPDRPIALTDAGFCFRRVLGIDGSEYYRPTRAGYRGNRACDNAATDDIAKAREWKSRGAGWMSAACHRSLYSYQVRTALALAVENPHVAATFVPLACTGARIGEGLFEGHRAREVRCSGRGRCPSTVPPQIAQAKAVLEGARRARPGRNFDLVLLTVGANDIHFSELVGNTLLASSRERALLESGGSIATVEDAQTVLQRQLPGAFARLRAALKPLVGGDLERVVYVSYGNPALNEAGASCAGGRAGVDVHPAFSIDGDMLRRTAAFVETQFLPRLKALALCRDGVICKDETDRMSFVDAHQQAFRTRGFCVRAESDPAFDKACFSPDGESFLRDLQTAAAQPLACDMRVREFRPYASRARWIRTPNDSYFAAMTYPDGLPATMQPADIHDAVWGVVSALYGGAIHPTAEGHAAMADATLATVRELLAKEGLVQSRTPRSPGEPLPIQPSVEPEPAEQQPE